MPSEYVNIKQGTPVSGENERASKSPWRTTLSGHFDRCWASSWCKPVTPDGYVEGPCMLKRSGVYHFMWSEGDWVNGTYHVCASTSRDPLDVSPAGRVIFESSDIANGPGHHGYVNIPGADARKIICHRRIIGDLESGHRVLCMDDMTFDGDEINPIIMT